MKREIENYREHIISLMRLHNPLSRDLEGTTTINPMVEVKLNLKELVEKIK